MHAMGFGDCECTRDSAAASPPFSRAAMGRWQAAGHMTHRCPLLCPPAECCCHECIHNTLQQRRKTCRCLAFTTVMCPLLGWKHCCPATASSCPASRRPTSSPLRLPSTRQGHGLLFDAEGCRHPYNLSFVTSSVDCWVQSEQLGCCWAAALLSCCVLCLHACHLPSAGWLTVQGMRIVVDSGCKHHTLVIITSGPVSGGQLSQASSCQPAKVKQCIQYAVPGSTALSWAAMLSTVCACASHWPPVTLLYALYRSRMPPTLHASSTAGRSWQRSMPL